MTGDSGTQHIMAGCVEWVLVKGGTVWGSKSQRAPCDDAKAGISFKDEYRDVIFRRHG